MTALAVQRLVSRSCSLRSRATRATASLIALSIPGELRPIRSASEQANMRRDGCGARLPGPTTITEVVRS